MLFYEESREEEEGGGVLRRRQGWQEIPKGREGCGHPHGAYNINGRWLGGDDRVTLAVERSMSHCHIVRLYVCRDPWYIYVYAIHILVVAMSPQRRAAPSDVK